MTSLNLPPPAPPHCSLIAIHPNLPSLLLSILTSVFIFALMLQVLYPPLLRLATKGVGFWFLAFLILRSSIAFAVLEEGCSV